METLELFKRQYEFNYWANLRALESLRSTKPVSAKATHALTQILMTEKLWLTRLLGENAGKVPSNLFRSVSQTGFEGMIEESFSKYEAYLKLSMSQRSTR